MCNENKDTARKEEKAGLCPAILRLTASDKRMAA